MSNFLGRNDLEKVFNETEKETMPLAQVLLEDFMLHLGTTSLIMLLEHLATHAKTAEEKEALKTIPEQILNQWEKNRAEVFVGGNKYMEIFSNHEKAEILSLDQKKFISEKFMEKDRQEFQEVVSRLRQAFIAIKNSM